MQYANKQTAVSEQQRKRTRKQQQKSGVLVEFYSRQLGAIQEL
jgi:hypothetical protein